MTADNVLPASPARHYALPRLTHERWIAFAIAVLIHAMVLMVVKTPPSPALVEAVVPAREMPPVIEDILEPVKTEPVQREQRERSNVSPPVGPELITIKPDIDASVQLPIIHTRPFVEGKVVTLEGYRGDGTGDSATPVTYLPSALDRVPQVVSRVAPVFPAAMKDRYDTATVKVTFIVTPEGRVSDIRILSSTHAGFEEAVERAISRWKFRAGWKNNRAVSTRMEQEIVFRLND